MLNLGVRNSKKSVQGTFLFRNFIAQIQECMLYTNNYGSCL